MSDQKDGCRLRVILPCLVIILVAIVSGVSLLFGSDKSKTVLATEVTTELEEVPIALEPKAEIKENNTTTQAKEKEEVVGKSSTSAKAVVHADLNKYREQLKKKIQQEKGRK